MSLKLGRRGLWGSRWSLRGREPPNVTHGRSSEIAVRPPFARMNVSIAAAPVRLFPKTCPWTIYTRVGHRQSSESLIVGVLDGLRRSVHALVGGPARSAAASAARDRKSTRLNSSHSQISYAVFCLKKTNTADSASLERVPAHSCLSTRVTPVLSHTASAPWPRCESPP